MNIANEDKKINAIAEQWVNLMLEQVRYQSTIEKKNKNKNKQNG